MKLINKRAFTLIELLAVIIVLAIVALVATPIVLDIIDEAKMSSLKSRYYSNIDIFRQYYANNYLSGNIKEVTFTCEDNICRNETNEDKLELDIEKGLVTIEENGKVNVDYMVIDGYLLKETNGELTIVKLIEENFDSNNLVINQNSNLFNLKIYGNSVQEGTPTPEIPIEVESVGNKTKNLINVTVELPYISNGLTVSRNSDGSINVKGTPTSAVSLYLARNVNFTLPAGTYTLNDTGVNGAHVYLLPKYHWKTFSIDSDTTYTGVYIDISQALVGQSLDFNFYPQLEEGRSFTGYEPYGYKIPVKVSGKNLFNKDTIEDNAILNLGNLLPGFSERFTSDYIDCENIDNVSINLGASFAWYDENKTIVSYENKSSTIFRNYTKPNGAKYLRVDFDKAAISSEQVLIVAGNYTADTMPEYETYREPITTNIYLDEPLRKVGNYTDYIDFKNQKIYRKIGNIVLDDSLPYTFYTYNTDLDNTYHFYISVTGTREPQIIPNTKMFSNRFIAGDLSMTKNVNDSLITSRYATRIYGQLQKSLIDSYEGATTKDKFIQYSNENYTEVNYVLLNPAEEEIALPNIPTYKGTNIIEIDTNILPSNIQMQYYENK